MLLLVQEYNSSVVVVAILIFLHFGVREEMITTLSISESEPRDRFRTECKINKVVQGNHRVKLPHAVEVFCSILPNGACIGINAQMLSLLFTQGIFNIPGAPMCLREDSLIIS